MLVEILLLVRSQGSILRYNTSGVYQATFYNLPFKSGTSRSDTPYRTLFTFGLGFDGTHFYLTHHQLLLDGYHIYNRFNRNIMTIKVDTSGTQVTSVIHATSSTPYSATTSSSTDISTSSKNYVSSNDASHNPDNHKFLIGLLLEDICMLLMT